MEILIGKILTYCWKFVNISPIKILCGKVFLIHFKFRSQLHVATYVLRLNLHDIKKRIIVNTNYTYTKIKLLAIQTVKTHCKCLLAS